MLWHFQVGLDCQATVYKIKVTKESEKSGKNRPRLQTKPPINISKKSSAASCNPGSSGGELNLLQEQALLSLSLSLHPSLALEVQLCPTREEEEDGCSRGVKTCTRTSGWLTQSEKCCMATVHKGSRFLRMYVSSVLVCGVFMCVCVSHRQTFIPH